jgi:hypothetical protein
MHRREKTEHRRERLESDMEVPARKLKTCRHLQIYHAEEVFTMLRWAGPRSAECRRRCRRQFLFSFLLD